MNKFRKSCRRNRRGVALFTLVATLGACSHFSKGMMAMRESPFPKSPEVLRRGEQVYFQYCAACHGERGAGDGPDGVKLPVKPTSFSDPTFEKSIGLVAANVRFGKGEHMPSFDFLLGEEEIWSVALYLQTLKKR